MQTISVAADKKGCLLVQFPPGLDIANAGRIEQLLIDIHNADPEHEWKLFLEFRKRYYSLCLAYTFSE